MAKPIRYSRQALKMLGRMDRKTAERIIEKVEQLAVDPTPLANNITRLKGEDGLLRLRVGDWRVIYEDGIVIAVERIAPRGSAYE
jgi:mRNA interferase RelE/StbE